MQTQHPIAVIFVILASTVIIIAGLMAAKAILVPVLLAAFIAIIISPLLFWLQNKGLNPSLSLISVLLFVVVLIFIVSIMVGSSMTDFTSDVPVYEAKLSEKLDEFFVVLKSMGIDFSQEKLKTLLDPSKLMHYTSNLFQAFTSLLTNSMMIMFLVIFMLLEASTLPQKFKALHVDILDHANNFITKVKQYMVFKTLFSLITGLLVMFMLLALGVNYALLWGLLAFLLNYIPNIGSIIAAVPAILLALIQLGSTTAIIVAIGFILINVIIGSVVEPKYMGDGLGISTLVVFLSLIFWGWVLGPIGMLLSIPLTVMLKIALETNHKSKWLAILMSAQAPKNP
jgi:AI-2 transport protein TqsA